MCLCLSTILFRAPNEILLRIEFSEETRTKCSLPLMGINIVMENCISMTRLDYVAATQYNVVIIHFLSDF